MGDSGNRATKLLPVVYGYQRGRRGATGRVALFGAELTAFCQVHNYSLGGVFCDWDKSEADSDCPGLAGAEQVLVMPETHGLVLPDWTHLATSLDRQTQLRLRLGQHGKALLVLADATHSLPPVATIEFREPRQTTTEHPKSPGSL